ncbi:MAG: biopolymer transporter ExbD [Deltaproteobacteria bacterium]|nr:biopolymer transporter ExbD [Deltaproteobacteria bacterium]
MAWNTKTNEEQLIAEINVTPLTDVMLVLLVIFMVTTPLIMAESFKVSLPRAVTSGPEKGMGPVLLISASGDLSLNGRDVSIERLRDELINEFDRTHDKTIIVKADGAALHRVVVKALDIAKLAGAERLSIATEPESR